MKIFRLFYETILEALFPISKEEQIVLSYSPEEAYRVLPKAPIYNPKEDFVNMSSVLAYKDPLVRKLVWALKYKGSKKATEICAYILEQSIIENLKELSTKNTLPLSIILIPTPISAKRRKERGYNQCELILDKIIVEHITQTIGSNVEVSKVKDLLIRTQHLNRQTKKGREDRLEDAKELFELNQELIQGYNKEKIFLIIDDVITTGSTMRETINTFRENGFRSAYGISVAH